MTTMPMTTRWGCMKLPAWDSLPDFGLYMDQMTSYADRCFAGLLPPEQHMITSAMINNYVKSGLMDRPQGKKYGRDSIGQMLMICILKQTTAMDALKLLLHRADGTTAEQLYHVFCTTQERIAADFATLDAPPDPLTCALEASSYQFLCQELLVRESAVPEPEA